MRYYGEFFLHSMPGLLPQENEEKLLPSPALQKSTSYLLFYTTGSRISNRPNGQAQDVSQPHHTRRHMCIGVYWIMWNSTQYSSAYGVELSWQVGDVGYTKRMRT